MIACLYTNNLLIYYYLYLMIELNESDNSNVIIPKSTKLHTKYKTSNTIVSISQSNFSDIPHSLVNENEAFTETKHSLFKETKDGLFNPNDKESLKIENVDLTSNKKNENRNSESTQYKKIVYEVNMKDNSPYPCSSKLLPLYDFFMFSPKEGEELISFYITGDQSSSKSIKLCSNDIFSNCKKIKYIGIYVQDIPNDHLFNYSNIRETVISNYITQLITIPKETHFLIDNKITETGLEEALYLAQGNKSNMFVLGYNSLKGPLGFNKNQSENLDFLLSKSKIPIMIMKEFNTRKEKKTQGFNWFILFDHSYINCFKAFVTFSHLIVKKLQRP